MFSFAKKFCSCDGGHKSEFEKRKEDAVEQDKAVREALSEKELDKGLKDTMEASDPVAKY